MRAPAAFIALPLIVGCGLGLLVGELTSPQFALTAAAAACLALFGALTSLLDDDSPLCSVCLIVGTFVVAVSLGTTAALRAYEPPLLAWYVSERPSTPLALFGTLREDAALTLAGVSLVLDVQRIGRCAEAKDDAPRGEAPVPAPCLSGSLGGVRLSVAGILAGSMMREWRAGRAVRVTATLREPTTYRNPGVPDERRALARRGVVLVGSVKSGAVVEVVGRGSRTSEAASAFRVWVRAALSAAVGCWSTRSSGVAAAIAIGDRTGLMQEDERRLQEAGTYHVIAISGGNIAILTLLLLGGMRTFGVPPRFAAAVAILVLIFYGRITGPAPSVDRAIAAAVLFLAGRLLDHRGQSINILAVAAVLGLTALPAAVFDPGFILSFGATLGILVFVPRAMKGIRGVKPLLVPVLLPLLLARFVAGAVGLLTATVAAEVALAPLAASLFARMTVAGVLLNFAAIPLMTVVQAGSIATFGVWLVHPAAAPGPGYVVHVAASWLIDSAQLVDMMPWLVRDVVPPAWWLVISYYAALIVGVVGGHRRARRVAAVTAIACGAVIAIGPQATARDALERPMPGVLRVIFLDVGQGDATGVLLPDGRALLIDAGGLPAAPLQDPADGAAFDIGERIVGRALRACGVRSLDTFVLTHADPDHVGGARSVIRSFRPRAIWEGVSVPVHVPLQLLVRGAEAIGADWRNVQAGDRLRISGVEISALHPPLPDWERQRVRNDDSIVLALRYGQVSVILPGDIGREGEILALRHLEPTPLQVLKAPHHGSVTSSTPEFVAATHPAAVIFSAGRANRFGHPALPVLQRYRALGAAMFSTADDGAVILDTDGRTVWIRGWGSGRVWQSTMRAQHTLPAPPANSRSSR